MSSDLDQLYADVPAPKHVWVTERQRLSVAATLATDAAWDAYLAETGGHVLQTTQWAQLKSQFGWQAERVLFRTIPSPDAPILGGASLLFRRLPWGQTVAYVPKGPAVDWGDRARVSAVLTMARAVAAKRRAALLKIEPELPDSPEWAALLTGLGFRPSPQRVQPLSTIHIDLGGDDETLLGRMKPKWRYNIRLAERKGVAVRVGGPADLPAVQALMAMTGARDGFGVHNEAYHAAATALFQPADQLAWLLAEYEGALLAAIAVFAVGRMAWYMWGASNDAGRNVMPNHAAQWAAMRWARARGCTVYDLWGIPDEVGAEPQAYAEPEHWGSGGLWGVYRFKQGFGGRVVRYVGAWDLPLSRPGYALYRLGLRLRRGRARE